MEGALSDCGCNKPARPMTFDLGDLVPAGEGMGDGTLGWVQWVMMAKEGAAKAGIDVDDWNKQVVDAFKDWTGLSACSPDNKAKYDDIVARSTPEEAAQWLRPRKGYPSGRVASATETCNEYALRRLHAHIATQGRAGLTFIAEARKAAEAAASRGWTDAKACRDGIQVALDASGLNDIDQRQIYNEVRGRCDRLPAAPGEQCAAPPEALLIGVGSDGFCAMTLAQRTLLLDQITAAQLTKAEQAELVALPISMRRAHFLAIVNRRVANAPPSETGGDEPGGGVSMTNLVVGLIIAGALAGGAWVWSRDDDDKGRSR